jgi:uncharacterized delta-60 repeat protein
MWSASPAEAAAGELDPTFGVGGKVTTDVTPKTDFVNGVTTQADGKVVVAGEARGKFALVRYDTDGSLDTSFGGDGKVTTNFSPHTDYADGVAIQADGKIVAAGISGEGGSNPRFAVARYLAA